MTKILAISGRKQSGKTTASKYIFGVALKALGYTDEFTIDTNGELNIRQNDDWVGFDPLSRNSEVQAWLAENIWSFIKIYNFADPLKQFCMQVFGLTEEQCYGDDEIKNSITKLRWDSVPTNTDKTGFMTAREVLQYFGSDICRKMYYDCWVKATLKNIQDDAPNFAIIADCRFPNEAIGVRDSGGTVVNLTRKISNDSHISETGLDDELAVNYHINNHDYTMDEKHLALDNILVNMDWIYVSDPESSLVE